MTDIVFHDRAHAGRLLAGALARYAHYPDVQVLALPRGGVPVAHEVACRLGAPLDVLVVRKIGVPDHEEYAMGAVASGGIVVRQDAIIDELHISKDEFAARAAEEEKEVQRREIAYRGHASPPAITGKTVILVDDGIATGATLRAAVKAVRQRSPRFLIVAAPVAASDSSALLVPLVDEVVIVSRPATFRGVSQWYEDFAQTTDAEVKRLLARHTQEALA
jgi:putative phosphoribosyl transferase